jgi:hypothetical protein
VTDSSAFGHATACDRVLGGAEQSSQVDGSLKVEYRRASIMRERGFRLGKGRRLLVQRVRAALKRSKMSFWRGGSRNPGGRPTTSCRSMSICRLRPGGELKWVDEGTGTSESREEGWAGVRLCNLAAQGALAAQGSVQAGGREGAGRAGDGTVGDYLL